MRVVSCILLLVVSVAVDATRPVDMTPWNSIADSVLSSVRDTQLQRGRQELHLRDLEREFKKSLGIVTLRGSFTATGGWLSDITTARRVGDVTVDRDGDVVRITAAVSWDDLRAGYRDYRLHINRDFDGSLEVKVRNNKVRAVFAFNLVDGECKTSLDNIKVEKLDDVDVKITGLGFLNFLAEFIGKWFIDRRKEDINSKLEEFFKSSIPEHLDDFYCDEYAAVLGIPI